MSNGVPRHPEHAALLHARAKIKVSNFAGQPPTIRNPSVRVEGSVSMYVCMVRSGVSARPARPLEAPAPGALVPRGRRGASAPAAAAQEAKGPPFRRPTPRGGFGSGGGAKGSVRRVGPARAARDRQRRRGYTPTGHSVTTANDNAFRRCSRQPRPARLPSRSQLRAPCAAPQPQAAPSAKTLQPG